MFAPIVSAVLCVGLIAPTTFIGAERDREGKRASRSAPRDAAFFRSLPIEWQRLAWCESRTTPHNIRYDVKSPSGEHVGVWQIHKGLFKAAGVDWRRASLMEQWIAARYTYNRQGARAWTCAKQAGLK